MGQWVAIANAKAGTSTPEEVEAVVEVLREQHEVRLVETAGMDELRDALADVAAGTVVAAIGGDGSLHAVVAALDDLDRLADVTVALVPRGTGNDFARTIGMDRDESVDAARQLLGGREVSIDLVRDEHDAVVVNAVHIGIGAEAAVEAKPWKKVLGPVGYAIGAAISGVKHKGFRARVLVDGEPIRHRGRIIQVAVGNGRYIGGGAPLLPEADPSDGLLDVAISWSNPRLRRLGYAWRLRKGRHPLRADVEYSKGRTVRVVGEATGSNADGEIGPPVTMYEWRIEPAAVRFLVPRDEERAEPSN